MNHALVIDGRNIYDAQEIKKWDLIIYVLVVYQYCHLRM